MAELIVVMAIIGIVDVQGRAGGVNNPARLGI